MSTGKTSFQIPSFEEIKAYHYMPAFDEAVRRHMAEIDAITSNPEAASFENTVVAFDRAGQDLYRVIGVFSNLKEAINDDELQAVAREVFPRLSKHSDNISLNAKLFDRIKTVYNERGNHQYDDEQLAVIEKYYKDFVRGGANLSEPDQATLREINEKLSNLGLTFNEHHMAETNENFRLVIDNADDLAGLPEFVRNSAAATASELGMEGKWVFTLQKPSMIPFLQYADNRNLRKQIFTAYCNRGNNDNEFDNKKIISEIASLEAQKAKLLGFDSYAAYALDNRMAKTPDAAKAFLRKVWTPALKKAESELAEMQAIVDAENGGYKIEAWDWWYVAEKLRKSKYDLNEAELKPYLRLENVRDGMFWLAGQLYGIRFSILPDAPKYHSDNEVFEVTEADGTKLGVLYLDYYPRSGKGSGAWCTSFRDGRYEADGSKTLPLVSIVCNFTKPTGDTPSLLTWDETETLFHEFGHALHSLFSDGKYRRISGDVPLDFVELPSQIMENWVSEPQVLAQFAKHWQTGEVMPNNLIEKLNNSGHFNQGFATVEVVAASLLDLAWYTRPADAPMADAAAFERATLDELGLIRQIEPRYLSTNFGHIFGGGYAAGYYVYLWAEVLDADAFAAFKESGDLFNKDLAAKFRQHCLAKVGAYDAGEQYVKFRGQQPSETALLQKRGLID